MSTLSPTKASRLVNATPFFYGWIILAAGTIGVIVMGPSQTFTVGVFIDSFINTFGISRSNVSLIYGVATLGGSLLLPITGRLVDRYGPSRMIILVTLGLGLSIMAVGLTHSVVMLLLALLALRYFGFGSMQLVVNNAIAQWFIRRRGIVMGIAGLSLAASLIIYPVLSEFLIQQFGWRGAWIILGLSVWIIMLPVGWFFFRDAPENYGLQPDGDGDADINFASHVSEENWTLAEARQTGAFWIFAAALSTMAMMMAGLVFHQISLFEVRGLSRETGVMAFNVMALTSIIGNLGMGRLLDKYSARLLLSSVLFLLAATIAFVQIIQTPLQGYIFSAMVGLTSGSFRVMDSVVWAKYFGRQHLGSIKGATMIGVIGATSLGPYPLGLSFDTFGSYSIALNILLLIPLVIAITTFFINRPEKQKLRSS
ncbi:MAG: MFS transporter [Anaerolineae bacterium]|nr:MFS transporter [Anaerolineae bacterium]